MTEKTLVSLFCGCGGFDVGAIQAGFRPILAVDNNPIAVKTYKKNVSANVIEGDLTSFASSTFPTEVDLVLGGPPCQGFSSAGPKRRDDPRNKLWSAYLHALQHCRPKAFVLENVTGFQREVDQFVIAVNNLVSNEYRIESKKMIMQYYGVPQFRQRLFVAGVRKDVASGFAWPMPTDPEIFDYTAEFPSMITIKSALEDLGCPIPAHDKMGDGELDHLFVPLNDEDEAIARHVHNGGSLKDIPDAHLPRTYLGRERGIRGWTWYYRKPRPHLPARTVIASIRPIYATILAPDVWYERANGQWTWNPVNPVDHTVANGLYTSPVSPRRLTVRECARLQTFPDDFRFFGTLLQKHNMIGNAVPCEFSRRLCESIQKLLDGEIEPPKSQAEQMLLFETG